LASILSGVGFGLFIDELGKFITRDNNYFFQPTIALIYLVFIGMFIAFRSLARQRRLTRDEYLLNAVILLEEAVIDDMDEPERNRVLHYLHQADQKHPLVAPLCEVLQKIKPVPYEEPSFYKVPLKWMEERYRQLVKLRMSVTIIDLVFIGKALIFLTVGILDIVTIVIEPFGHHEVTLSVIELISTVISAGLVVAGVWMMHKSRLRAYELFSRSLLFDIFITQFFAFYHREFAALPGFIINVALYVALQILLQQERRESLRSLSSVAPSHSHPSS